MANPMRSFVFPCNAKRTGYGMVGGGILAINIGHVRGIGNIA